MNYYNFTTPGRPRKITSIVIAVIVTGLLFQSIWSYQHTERPISITNLSTDEQILHQHSTGRCMPEISDEEVVRLRKTRSACRNATQSSQFERQRIAIVSVNYGPQNVSYQPSLGTHLQYANLHDLQMHVLCTPILDHLWNKPAFILSLVLVEMAKPPQRRLQWMFWTDRDSIILDQCRSLEEFLPSPAKSSSTKEGKASDDHEDIYLLATKDWNGLNNGIFLLRVNDWAVDLFTAILAFRYYRPYVDLPFTEQSAMEIVMKEPQFKEKVRIVPQHWFNAYPKGKAQEFRDRTTEDGLEKYHARRGDFLLHFAGISHRDKAIAEWVKMLEQSEVIWSKESVQRDVTHDVAQFWGGKLHA
jgi:hypothetical protein